MKKFLRLLFRGLVLLPAIILQVLYYVLIFNWLKDFAVFIKIMMAIAQTTSIIYIINKREESNYKVLWCLIILSLPFIGVWLYLVAGNHRTSKPIEKRLNKNMRNFDIQTISLPNDSDTNRTFNLIHKLSKMPILPLQNAKYYSLGEEIYVDMLTDLKNAKHFIFIEYFIIENGKFWNSIVDILKQKVKDGVMVKILYDDIGSIATYSFKSRHELKKAGIDIISFNPVTHGIHMSLNNRDHRKIMVIDNKVAYSGGINIADEYINEIERFGHWKDIGFRVTNEAVFAFTYLFVTFWNAYSKHKINMNSLPEFIPNKAIEQSETNSKILTYYDSPVNNESISNNYFINILSTAEKYVYFYTPYLILNDSLKDAFIQAAERQIDVRIIIPGIPDKKHPYMLTIKYAEELARYGVKIYLYTKGFIHAKATIVDDRLCSIGSVNLDYRSLFLHYENNSIFEDKNILNNLKQDFLDTQNQSSLLKEKKRNIFVRIYKSIINVFSPLL